jgi:serine/threonine-protein kinase HipA
MSLKKTKIWVYAHWIGMPKPKLIGILSVDNAKGRNSYSFEYNPEWIKSNEQLILDPDISWHSGAQYPNKKENFGVFLDSMPDTWGRTLMKRRASNIAKETNQTVQKLYDIDYLLGVFDECRMGALRFKLSEEGNFLDDNKHYPTPPWSSISELQHGIDLIESDIESKEVNEWLKILIAAGTSLGGARPKSNILDKNRELWIAKFPSKNDTIDKAAWEYLAYKLALKSGIEMSESKIQKVSGNHHTFFTKRFDRINNQRIHFASAMTMTGYNENIINDNPASYLEIAEFIQNYSCEIKSDLEQLWRRIVFNIAISNTDDHLRNHGFIIKGAGWRLSPAYDVNPSVDKNGLALNIDMENNNLDFELAKSVGEFFQLSEKKMNKILDEVKNSVNNWKKIALGIDVLKKEIQYMEAAFLYKSKKY